jgi:hypothetical protein
MESEVKLLNCPFCGQGAVLYEHPEHIGFVVTCGNEEFDSNGDSACICTDLMPIFSAENEAIAAWNRRAPVKEGGLQHQDARHD